jgi:hypothetical protein
VVSAKQENFIKSEYEMRLIIVVVQVGAVKIYVATEEALRKKERGDETQFTTKIGGKLVWVPAISLGKISFLVTRLMPYYVETGHFHPLIA